MHTLERRMAELTGKESALFVPSGTMGNQLAVNVLTRPGDQVVLDAESHIFLYEQAGIATASGCIAWTVRGQRGVITPAQLDEPFDEDQVEDDHIARTTLVCIENTQNRHGGAIVPLEALRALAAHARERGVRVHLDGARLWNASVATGIPLRDWAATADTVMMCFSKGLGAPIGSILVGPAEAIRRARRVRKRLGGGMRQVGILAAAGIVALERMVDRLAEDHANARRLAEGLAKLPGLRLDLVRVETNIVIFFVTRPGGVEELTRGCAARKVKVHAIGPTSIRCVTHKDVDADDVARALDAFGEITRGW